MSLGRHAWQIPCIERWSGGRYVGIPASGGERAQPRSHARIGLLFGVATRGTYGGALLQFPYVGIPIVSGGKPGPGRTDGGIHGLRRRPRKQCVGVPTFRRGE